MSDIPHRYFAKIWQNETGTEKTGLVVTLSQETMNKLQENLLTELLVSARFVRFYRCKDLDSTEVA
jgi:hypothetical protein